ncbi:DUF402 domain-containing protein [Piscibacillus sp. B03]|uniref:DUF402 domain-containing protein n=1 Tax=Piscibacillus sp. B03 TaxID=3457430 RepID=UPI003FCC5414
MGNKIHIKAKKADGRVYRHFETELLDSDQHEVRVIQRIGDPIYGEEETWYARNHLIFYFWLNEPFNAFETYTEDGVAQDIYMNIASPAEFDGKTITYTDYELDLILRPGEDIELLDEDEFIEAKVDFNYSDELISDCYEAVEQGKAVIKNWKWNGWNT